MAAKKPKHPNAKTYTNKRTGKVTRIGAKPKAVKPPANPLDAAVSSAITSQVSPYEAAAAERAKQYEADTSNTEAINARLQQNLVGIQNTLATANNDALGLAAQRGTASAERMAANQSFLQSVLGNYVGDGGVGLQGASQHAGVQVAADAAGNTRSVYDAGQAANGNLASQRGALTLAVGERANDFLQKRMADQRSIQNEIARIRGQAPMLKRQFGREDEELRIAKNDLALRRQQLGDQRAANQAQIDLGYYQTDASAAAAAAGDRGQAAKDAKANRSVYANIVPGMTKENDDKLHALFQSVASPNVQGADGSTAPNPARRYKALVQAMQGMGLSGGQAALLAASWVPERLKIHGANSPYIVYKMLKGGGGEFNFKLSDAVIQRIFKTAGLDWSKRTRKPVTPAGTVKPILDSVGGMFDGAPKPGSKPPVLPANPDRPTPMF